MRLKFFTPARDYITKKTLFLGFLALVFVVARLSPSSGYELSEVPDFSDKGRWSFVEERPLVYVAPWAMYEIGRIKKYRHVDDPLFVGFEEFIFGREKPFWKRWAWESSPHTYHALRKKGSEEWVVGPPGSFWRSAAVFDGIELKGVWFLLFVQPREEASGGYFPISTYRFKAITHPEKGDPA